MEIAENIGSFSSVLFDTVAIVGVGLIGGSLAYSLKDNGLVNRIIGVDENAENAAESVSLGIVDAVVSLDDAILQSDLIIVATPVSATEKILPIILNQITDKQIVIDVGSTKNSILKAVAHSTHLKRFLPTHPMWGTEFSGPAAAVHGGFVKKAVVLCSKETVDADVVTKISEMYLRIGMHLVDMDSSMHDMHVAYVSHISHITSYALANTVLEKEKQEEAIFNLASGGFESTVRLAKSPSSMWVPILMQNRTNVLDVLREHIDQLEKFYHFIAKDDWDGVQGLMENANKIRKVLDKKTV